MPCSVEWCITVAPLQSGMQGSHDSNTTVAALLDEREGPVISMSTDSGYLIDISTATEIHHSWLHLTNETGTASRSTLHLACYTRKCGSKNRTEQALLQQPDTHLSVGAGCYGLSADLTLRWRTASNATLHFLLWRVGLVAPLQQQ